MLSSTYGDFQVFLHFLGSNKLNIAIFVIVNLSIDIDEIILMVSTTNLFLIGLLTHFNAFFSHTNIKPSGNSLKNKQTNNKIIHTTSLTEMM